jgi:hypothetical protein
MATAGCCLRRGFNLLIERSPKTGSRFNAAFHAPRRSFLQNLDLNYCLARARRRGSQPSDVGGR